ncbi:SMI1/KNR4 family protein [Streptomyces sp. t39]|uniref:SMI1/KNR4 family protein n=1 Tax=Streptomyces sp. t39 TaxID=1828156 RepID=UPI0011CDD162|nr:SMI1/KNR4 family protein [Streptomyces sp. t39]TXS48134.1 SMI1/KNR4 family protein [Streptomyces sp. t39]
MMWTGVRERVLALRDAPRWRQVFGADRTGHGFELLPVLTPGQLAAVEARLGVTLPREYRAFLLEVGAGGAGPDYGLFPLRPPAPGAPPADRQAARPFRPELTALLDEHARTEPQPADHTDDDAFVAAHAAWQAREDALYDALVDGTLHLGDRGCAYDNLLVVTGPLSGTVWEDVRAVGEGVVPLRLDSTRGHLSFAGWYHHWLTAAERTAWTEETATSAQ